MDDPRAWASIVRVLKDVSDVLNLRLVCTAAAIGIAPASVWHSPKYPTQKQVLEWVNDQRGKALNWRAWAVDAFRPDKKKPGEWVMVKHYYAMNEMSMYRMIQYTPMPRRNFYELLVTNDYVQDRPRGVFGASLYFDIEYLLGELNPGRTPDEFDLVKEKMLASFRAAFDRELSDKAILDRVHVLNSSNASKFSLHLIVRMKNKDGKGVVLMNPFHVGAFARRWEQWEREREDREDLLFAREKDGTEAFILDLGVATKWRPMRMIGQTKGTVPGKVPAPRYLRLEGSEGPVSFRLWLDLLIQQNTNAPADEQCIECLETDGSEPASGNFRYGTKADERRKRNHSALALFGAPAGSNGLNSETRERDQKRSRHSLPPPSVAGGLTVSDMVLQWVKEKTGDPGVSMIGVPREDSFLINTPNTHTCKTLASRTQGRITEHQSNHVFYSFRMEVMSMNLVQHCHDQQCKEAKGRMPSVQAPQSIRDAVRMAMEWVDAVKKAQWHEAVSKHPPGSVKRHRASKKIHHTYWTIWSTPVNPSHLPIREVSQVLATPDVPSELKEWLSRSLL